MQMLSAYACVALLVGAGALGVSTGVLPAAEPAQALVQLEGLVEGQERARHGDEDPAGAATQRQQRSRHRARQQQQRRRRNAYMYNGRASQQQQQHRPPVIKKEPAEITIKTEPKH